MGILPFLCILNNLEEPFCQTFSKTASTPSGKPFHQRSRSPAKQVLHIIRISPYPIFSHWIRDINQYCLILYTFHLREVNLYNLWGC